MSENPMLAWALYYHALGLVPIPTKITPGPLKDEKKPLVKWKVYHTTNTRPSENEIQQWFGPLFPNAAIGILSGPISGVFILDVENKGVELIKQYEIPNTWMVRTRRGFHYYFKWPKTLENISTNLSAIYGEDSGVDTRGWGGFAVVPPSRCGDSTLYSWVDGHAPHEIALAETPTWLIEKLLVKPVEQTIAPKDGTSTGWLAEVLEGVGDGERHEALKKLAGYYFNCMHPDIAGQHLREWNQKNTPPYTLGELEEQITDFTKRFKNGEYESKFLAKQAAEPKDITLVTASDLIKQHAHRPEYLADRLIPVGCSVIFAGWQGLGKTFVATDLAIEVSKKSGPGLWLGEFPVKKGPVLWIDNEMGGGLTSYRLRQLLSSKGLRAEDLNLYYHARNRVKLTSEKHYSQLRKELEQIGPVLVVIDSMASCHTLNENDSADMRHFFDDLIAPLCDEFKCVMLFVDHERKQQAGMNATGGQRLRGSGAKGDSVDAILSLDKREDVLIFEHSKARYSKRLDPFAIEIKDIASGVIVRKMDPA